MGRRARRTLNDCNLYAVICPRFSRRREGKSQKKSDHKRTNRRNILMIMMCCCRLRRLLFIWSACLPAFFPFDMFCHYLFHQTPGEGAGEQARNIIVYICVSKA